VERQCQDSKSDFPNICGYGWGSGQIEGWCQCPLPPAPRPPSPPPLHPSPPPFDTWVCDSCELTQDESLVAFATFSDGKRYSCSSTYETDGYETTVDACYTGWQADYGALFHRYCTCPSLPSKRKLLSADDAQVYDEETCPPYSARYDVRHLLAQESEDPPAQNAQYKQVMSWLEVITQKIADWIIRVMSVKRVRVAWRQKSVDVNLVQCELNNVLCKTHGLGVSNAVEIMTLTAVGFLLVCQLMGVVSLGVFTLVTTPVSIFAFLALSHGVSPLCFPASIPVCFFDDIIDISENTFAKHIARPKGLSERDTLERLDGVINCKDLGFTDFFVSLEFYLQTTFNEKTLNNNFINITYYDMFSMAQSARETVKKMDKDDVANKSCATINRLSAFALVFTVVCVLSVLANLLPTLLSAIFSTPRIYVIFLHTIIDNTKN
jgi:hypothetical protein